MGFWVICFRVVAVFYTKLTQSRGGSRSLCIKKLPSGVRAKVILQLYKNTVTKVVLDSVFLLDFFYFDDPDLGMDLLRRLKVSVKTPEKISPKAMEPARRRVIVPNLIPSR